MKIKLFTIPNLLTLSNLLCGTIAAVAVLTYGDLRLAFWLLVLAAAFDFFDGFTARLLHQSSPIGLQLDSLADMVSSGVTPTAIMLTLAWQAGSSWWAADTGSLWSWIVLLLPVGEGMGTFYRRRIGRIVPPLVFWSLALPLLFFAYMHTFGAATQSPSVDPASYTAQQLFTRMYTFVFNFNYDTTPLWYLYMLVGLYLVMPVLSAWMRQASQREMQLFLAVWGVALLLPYVKMAAPLLGYAGNGGNMGLWGVCDWNDYGMFYYFSGFVGYLVLANYLVRYPLQWSWRRTLGVMVPLFVAGYLITALGFVATQNRFPGNFAYLEIVWYFCGINVFMMTLPVFVIVQKLAVAARPWLARLASLTFGIYLCHFAVIPVCYDLLDCAALPDWVRLVGMSVAAFAVSVFVVWAMSRWRVTRRVVM